MEEKRTNTWENIGIVLGLLGGGFIYYIMSSIFGTLIGIISSVFGFFVLMGFWIFIGNIFKAINKNEKNNGN